MISLRTALVAVLFLCVSACGGGGGGGGGSSSLSLDKSSLTFAAEDPNSPPSAQTILATFKGDGVIVGTLPGASVPNWLYASAPSPAASPVSITVGINSTSLTPGRYSTTLRFVSGKADGSEVVTKDVSVTYTVDHKLTPATTEIATYAGAVATTKTISLAIANDTWEASSNQPWLTVSPTSGTGPATLTVTASTTGVSLGDQTATLTVRDTQTNRSRTAVIKMNVAPRRLNVEERGIALTSTLGASNLSRSVKVVDTAGLNARWTAADDAPWLSVSPSGVAGSAVTLTADPTGLADGMHYATVTVQPDNEPGLTNSDTIAVGFFVDHASGPPPDVLTPAANTYAFGGLAADPIRPYVYAAHSSGTPATTVINVINVHTGAVEDTLTFPATLIERLVISPTGELLLATNRIGKSIIPISLQGSIRTVGAPWTGIRFANWDTDFAFTQVNGADVILSSERQILDAATGAVLGEFEAVSNVFTIGPARIVAAPDGSAAFLFGDSVGNHYFSRVALSGSGNAVRAIAGPYIVEAGDTGAQRVSRDSKRLVTLSSGSPSLNVYDTQTATLVASKSTNNYRGALDLAPNGDAYEGGRNTDGIVTRYSENLTLLGQRTLALTAGYSFGELRVSGDGLRVVIVVYGGNGAAEMRVFSSALPP